MNTIQIEATGSLRNLNILLDDLRPELEAAETQLIISAPSARNFAAEVAIAVSGAVLSHFLNKFIDRLFSSNNTLAPHVHVHLHHKDSGATFTLPEQNSQCVEYFRGLETNAEMTSDRFTREVEEISTLLNASTSDSVRTLLLTRLLALATQEHDISASSLLVKIVGQVLNERQLPLLDDGTIDFYRLLTSPDAHVAVRLYALGISPVEPPDDLQIGARLGSELRATLTTDYLVLIANQERSVAKELLKPVLLAGMYPLALISSDANPDIRAFLRRDDRIVRERIMAQTEVVEGTRANSELKFGVELLRQASSMSSFAKLVNHEIGHLFSECHMSLPVDDPRHLINVSSALSELKEEAIKRVSEPLAEGDPRVRLTNGGLSLVYTIDDDPRGFRHVISYQDKRSFLSLFNASRLAYVVLRTLNTGPIHLSFAYTEKGTFMIGFILEPAAHEGFCRTATSSLGPGDALKLREDATAFAQSFAPSWNALAE